MMKMKFNIIIALILIGCSAAYRDDKSTCYNFRVPDEKVVIPDTLREISGLTIIDPSTFTCIQDENGILFIYDIQKHEIRKQFTFHIDGDYEGIAHVNNSMYILRSDGTLIEISEFQTPDFRTHTYNTGIPAENNEGLCYDPVIKQLLVGSKGKIAKGPDYKDKRVIYGFDLQTKTLKPEPVFNFDVLEIKEFAIKNNIDVPYKKHKKKGESVSEPLIKFRTSAIGIHPVTKRLYLLSASDYMLFIFDMDGKLEHIEMLDPAIFNKSEGISFFSNGDVLITNEAEDKRPTVLRFNCRK